MGALSEYGIQASVTGGTLVRGSAGEGCLGQFVPQFDDTGRAVCPTTECWLRVSGIQFAGRQGAISRDKAALLAPMPRRVAWPMVCLQ